MRFAAFCSFAAASLLSYAARSQVQPVALSWEAPPECPSRESVVAGVRRLLRAAPETPLSARARVSQQRNRWIAELETPSGRRTLEAESCLVLAETVSVILAIAVDPAAVNRVAESARANEPREDARAGSSGAATPTVTATPSGGEASQAPAPAPNPTKGSDRLTAGSRTPDRWTVGLSLRALLEFGILPGPAFGGTLAIRLERGIWGFELGASALLPQEAELDADPTHGGTMRWFGGHVLGCVAPRIAISCDVCAGVELGRLSGAGFGVDVPRTGHALWFAPLVTSGLRYPLAASLSFEARLVRWLPFNKHCVTSSPRTHSGCSKRRSGHFRTERFRPSAPPRASSLCARRIE
jgi:hypothetical protein